MTTMTTMISNLIDLSTHRARRQTSAFETELRLLLRRMDTFEATVNRAYQAAEDASLRAERMARDLELWSRI